MDIEKVWTGGRSCHPERTHTLPLRARFRDDPDHTAGRVGAEVSHGRKTLDDVDALDRSGIERLHRRPRRAHAVDDDERLGPHHPTVHMLLVPRTEIGRASCRATV